MSRQKFSHIGLLPQGSSTVNFHGAVGGIGSHNKNRVDVRNTDDLRKRDEAKLQNELESQQNTHDTTSVEEKWQCTACTYLNVSTTKLCEICERHRPSPSDTSHGNGVDVLMAQKSAVVDALVQRLVALEDAERVVFIFCSIVGHGYDEPLFLKIGSGKYVAEDGHSVVRQLTKLIMTEGYDSSDAFALMGARLDTLKAAIDFAQETSDKLCNLSNFPPWLSLCAEEAFTNGKVVFPGATAMGLSELKRLMSKYLVDWDIADEHVERLVSWAVQVVGWNAVWHNADASGSVQAQCDQKRHCWDAVIMKTQQVFYLTTPFNDLFSGIDALHAQGICHGLLEDGEGPVMAETPNDLLLGLAVTFRFCVDRSRRFLQAARKKHIQSRFVDSNQVISMANFEFMEKQVGEYQKRDIDRIERLLNHKFREDKLTGLYQAQEPETVEVSGIRGEIVVRFRLKKYAIAALEKYIAQVYPMQFCAAGDCRVALRLTDQSRICETCRVIRKEIGNVSIMFPSRKSLRDQRRLKTTRLSDARGLNRPRMKPRKLSFDQSIRYF